MNYSDIKTVALGYSDREDAEVINMIDNFIAVVESRINRILKVQNMTVRSVTATVADQEYYGLPTDFAGMRDIEVRASIDAADRDSLYYAAPDQMNIYANNTGTKVYYTIIADQIQIMPAQEAGKVIEMVYYKKVPNLNSTDNTNWLGDAAPDVYVFGLLVEISSFVKDGQAADLWDKRFQSALAEMVLDDSITRWSGSPLAVRHVDG